MYFPYLRGKQFELLAVREMADAILSSGKVNPVFEPVRDLRSSNTLQRNVGEISKRGFPFTIVANPTVGDIAGLTGTTDILDLISSLRPLNESIRIGVCLTSEDEVSAISREISSLNFTPMIDLFYGSSAIDSSSIEELSGVGSVQYHYGEDKNPIRRHRDLFREPRTVLLRDSFHRRDRNQDYCGIEPYIFSSDNVFFEEDGYTGFGDFQTIGAAFREGGSLPRVVAIHLTYRTSEDEAIYIKHFCSTPNGTSADTAGKYLEALEGLIEFVDLNSISNPAIEMFRSHFNNRVFPGLGVIKKISIMNHIFVCIDSVHNA